MDVGITRRTKDLYKLGCRCENEVPAIETQEERREKRREREKERENEKQKRSIDASEGVNGV